MLDTIPDDYFTYLCNLNFQCYKDSSCLFLTCNKLYHLNNIITNSLLKQNYNTIICDNYITNSKKTYYNINDVYGNNLVNWEKKIGFLARQSILTENVELLDLLYKLKLNSIHYDKILMIKTALDIKSLSIIDCLSSRVGLFRRDEIKVILKHYYNNKIDSPIILKSIIHKTNHLYDDTIMKQALIYDDLDTVKSLINVKNIDLSLEFAIKRSNIEIVKYITSSFIYDKGVIIGLIKYNATWSRIMDSSMLDLLLEIQQTF